MFYLCLNGVSVNVISGFSHHLFSFSPVKLLLVLPVLEHTVKHNT